MNVTEGRVERILLKSAEHVEIRYSDEVPSPGDVVRSDGREWLVERVTEAEDAIACMLVPSAIDLA